MSKELVFIARSTPEADRLESALAKSVWHAERDGVSFSFPVTESDIDHTEAEIQHRIIIPNDISGYWESYKKGGAFKKLCPVGTEIQTLIFAHEAFKNEDYVKAWAREHGFKYGSVDETGTSWRLRQQEPENFTKDSFRTITITDGVKAVIGCPIYKETGGNLSQKVKIYRVFGGLWGNYSFFAPFVIGNWTANRQKAEEFFNACGLNSFSKDDREDLIDYENERDKNGNPFIVVFELEEALITKAMIEKLDDINDVIVEIVNYEIDQIDEKGFDISTGKQIEHTRLMKYINFEDSAKKEKGGHACGCSHEKYATGGSIGKYFGGQYLNHHDIEKLKKWQAIEKKIQNNRGVKITPYSNEYNTRFGYEIVYLDNDGSEEGSHAVSGYSKQEAFENLLKRFENKYSEGGGFIEYEELMSFTNLKDGNYFKKKYSDNKTQSSWLKPLQQYFIKVTAHLYAERKKENPESEKLKFLKEQVRILEPLNNDFYKEVVKKEYEQGGMLNKEQEKIEAIEKYLPAMVGEANIGDHVVFNVKFRSKTADGYLFDTHSKSDYPPNRATPKLIRMGIKVDRTGKKGERLITIPSSIFNALTKKVLEQGGELTWMQTADSGKLKEQDLVKELDELNKGIQYCRQQISDAKEVWVKKEYKDVMAGYLRRIHEIHLHQKELQKLKQQEIKTPVTQNPSPEIWRHKHLDATAKIISETAKGYKVELTTNIGKKPKITTRFFDFADFKGPNAIFEKQFNSKEKKFDKGGSLSDDVKLWDAYIKFVDGIDGIISEHGELSDSYWKEGTEAELDSITGSIKTVGDVQKNRERIIDNATALLDGLIGTLASGRISEDRYFQPGAVNGLKTVLAPEVEITHLGAKRKSS